MIMESVMVVITLKADHLKAAAQNILALRKK